MLQLQADLVERRLCHLKEDQSADSIRGDLTSDLTADATGRPRHHHHLTSIELPDGTPVLLYRLAEEEILDPHLTDAVQSYRVAAGRGDSRQEIGLQIDRLAVLHHLLPLAEEVPLVGEEDPIEALGPLEEV